MFLSRYLSIDPFDLLREEEEEAVDELEGGRRSWERGGRDRVEAV